MHNKEKIKIGMYIFLKMFVILNIFAYFCTQ